MGLKVGDINPHKGNHPVYCSEKGFGSNGSIEKFQIFAIPGLHGCICPSCLYRSYLKSRSEGTSGGFIHVYIAEALPA